MFTVDLVVCVFVFECSETCTSLSFYKSLVLIKLAYLPFLCVIYSGLQSKVLGLVREYCEI